jgi:O-antigen/teichoic acid export membrane protein
MRRVGPNTLYTLLGVALNAFAGILTARLLNPSDRGFVAVAISTSGLVAVASALGSNVSFKARYYRERDVNLPGFVTLAVLLGVLLAVPALLLTAFITGRLVDERTWTLQGAVCFVAVGASTYLWFQTREALASQGSLLSGAIINAAGSGALLFCLGIVWFTGIHNVFSVVWAYVLSFVMQCSLGGYLLSQKTTWERPRGVLTLLRTGPRFLGYHFGQDLVFRLDRYLLGAFAGTTAVGYYAVASTPAELLRIPSRVASQYVLLDASRGTINVAQVLRLGWVWFGISAVLVPPVWLAAPWLITLIFGSEYHPATEPFRILIVAQLFLVPFLILSRGIVGLGGSWASTLPGLAGLAALVVASVVLMPSHGAIGAAFACLIAFLSMSSVAYFAIRRLRAPLTQGDES